CMSRKWLADECETKEANSMLNATDAEKASAVNRKARVAFVVAILGWVAVWTAIIATPWILRSSVRTGDYENVFVAPAIVLAIALALNAAALILGIIAIRNRAHVGGFGGVASVAIAASGLAG